MIREFKLPDVGEGVAEGELVAWLVDVGDEIGEDQPLAEVETDKALVEIPSPFEGRIAELRAEEGEMVPVGDVIVTVEVDEGDGEAADDASDGDEEEAGDAAVEPSEEQATGGRTFAPPSVRRLARELGVDIADVAGSGPSGRVTDADVRAAAEREESPGPRSVGGGRSVVTRTEGGDAPTPEAAPDDVESADRDRTLAVPATRRVADELGVDLDSVPASEERNDEAYVTEGDVRAYAESLAAAEASATTETSAAGTKPKPRSVDGVADAVTEAATAAGDATSEPRPGGTVPYRGVRRSIGEQMARSKYTAPHVTHTDEVDVSALVALREDLTGHTDARLTYMPFVLKAVAAALSKFPSVNASLDEEAEEIRLHDEYNVGVATATEAGLLVPVVDDVDRKSIPDIAREVADLAERARNRTISREEMQGGTFTVTNVGVIGGEYATPIVNYPEVAILALGAIKQRPWVDDGEVVARTTLPLSLSIDHRVVDGAVAARFTNRIKELLANPNLLLLE
jgi:pyruvate dehydrogenase E2 component (dihydrolipoamide acetyltransferase)